MKWRRLLLVTICLLASLIGCREMVTDSEPHVEALLQSASVLVPGSPDRITGCAQLTVAVSARSEISTQLVSGCDSLRIQITESTFDRTDQVVRLKVTVINDLGRTVRGPVKVIGWSDSLRVIAPAGLASNKHGSEYLAFLAADSVEPDGFAWHFAGDNEPLADGASTATREIVIAVKQGVSAFTATFHAEGRPALTAVPAVAPDSIPTWVLSPAFRASRTLSCTAVDYVRNVLTVAFDAGTPLAAKQAAIGSVNGEVIGGTQFAGTDGFYFVQVDEGPDGEGLCAAAAALAGFPDVLMVLPIEMFWSGTYLKPNDATGFTRNDWQIYPDSATGVNWAVEAIAAPLAWGCTTGNTTTEVAIVDIGFFSAADFLNQSRTVDFDKLNPTILKNTHGHAVMSIVGATGNNSQGITGVMWDSRMRLYDASIEGGVINVDSAGVAFSPLYNIVQDLRAAAMSNASVINLSMGFDWNVFLQRGILPGSRLAQRYVHGLYAQMRNVFRGIPQQELPLIVISAGNNGIDAEHGVFPLLARDYPNNVVVVAGIERNPNGSIGLWRQSNVGPLVTVAAPALDVAALHPLGATISFAGTSAAAPLVTGIAGLLHSFDPRLTPAEIRGLIRDGAIRGGRTVAGIPVANAYESLKLAAQRQGAPLCGNRLWFQETRAFASRNSGSEFLFDIGEPGEYLNALHGGRRIRAWAANSRDDREFAFAAGRWSEVPAFSAPGIDGGTFNSMFAVSHDGELGAVSRVNDQSISVFTRDPRTRVERLVTSFVVPTTNTSGSFCSQAHAQYETVGEGEDSRTVFVGYQCSVEQQLGVQSERLTVRTAVYPAGDRILVALTRTLTSMTGTSGFQPCPEAPIQNGIPARVCQAYSFFTATVGTTFYSVAINTGQVLNLGSMPDFDSAWIGVSEGGSEITTAGGAFTSTETLEWAYTNFNGDFQRSVAGPQVRSNCSIRFAHIMPFLSLLSSVTNTNACDFGEGNGTIAPRTVSPLPAVKR